MAKVLWALSFFSSIGAIIYYNLTTVSSAPQQAALAAMSLAIAILPYCLARAGSEYEQIAKKVNREDNELDEIQSILLDHLILNKIKIIYNLTNVEHLSKPSYEQIMHRVDCLKKLCDQELITSKE